MQFNTLAMKHLNSFLILLITVALFISCKKDDVPPMEQLPPATQTGKNTFGCLVNGKAFIPKGSMFSGPILQSYYQYVDGEYYFHVSAADKSEPSNIFSVRINAKNFQITKAGSFEFAEPVIDGKPIGTYANTSNAKSKEYNTSTALAGELKITHFDLEKQIVSGTFWFDAVNQAGEKVEVREGRFDMHFTR